MDTGQPQASIMKNIFEGVVSFLPDWLQIPILCLIVLLVVLGWIASIRGKLARRRAARSPQPVAAPPAGGGSGADFLGPYAPPAQQPAGPSGAGFLGPYAPAAQQPAQPPAAPAGQQQGGAAFLGSYAPPARPGGDDRA